MNNENNYCNQYSFDKESIKFIFVKFNRNNRNNNYLVYRYMRHLVFYNDYCKAD